MMFAAKFIAVVLSVIACVSAAPAAPSSSAVKGGANSTDVADAAAAHSGSATHYNPTGGVHPPQPGACGQVHHSKEHVVALPPGTFNNGNACGRHLTAHHNGKSVKVKVVDLCPGCSGGDLDLSPSAFKKLAPLPEGRIHVTWNFN